MTEPSSRRFPMIWRTGFFKWVFLCVVVASEVVQWLFIRISYRKCKCASLLAAHWSVPRRTWLPYKHWGNSYSWAPYPTKMWSISISDAFFGECILTKACSTSADKSTVENLKTSAVQLAAKFSQIQPAEACTVFLHKHSLSNWIFFRHKWKL